LVSGLVSEKEEKGEKERRDTARRGRSAQGCRSRGKRIPDLRNNKLPCRSLPEGIE
jgi:hypothetical protein